MLGHASLARRNPLSLLQHFRQCSMAAVKRGAELQADSAAEPAAAAAAAEAPPPAAASRPSGTTKPAGAKRQRLLAPLPPGRRPAPGGSGGSGGSRKGSGGSGGYKELAPGQHALPGGGRIMYHTNLMPPAAAAELFDRLKQELPWQQRPVTVMGRTVMQPRLIAYQADGAELAVGCGQGLAAAGLPGAGPLT